MIVYWILSILLIATSILLSYTKTSYSILAPWQVAYLVVRTKDLITNRFYSVALGISFTGFKFISPFTT